MATRSNAPNAKKSPSRSRAKKAAKRKSPARTTPVAKRSTPAKPAAVRTTVKTADASKQSRLITLLRSEPGATIHQMVKLTGWQPHTVRAVISSALRKRLGLNITAGASGEGRARIYRIVGTPTAA